MPSKSQSFSNKGSENELQPTQPKSPTPPYTIYVKPLPADVFCFYYHLRSREKILLNYSLFADTFWK